MAIINKNAIVQVNDTADKGWVGCLLQVDEVHSWGVTAFIQTPHNREESEKAFIRLEWDKIEYIGEAVLIPMEEQV